MLIRVVAWLVLLLAVEAAGRPFSSGEHTLRAVAVHPSGWHSPEATSTFTVAPRVEVVTTQHDGEGRVVQQTGGGRTRTFAWSEAGLLRRVEDRDALANGWTWEAVYDPLGRRVRTEHRVLTAGVPGPARVVESLFDPLAEFLEAGVAVDGVLTWLIHGPDVDGALGSWNGTGGLEATRAAGAGPLRELVDDWFGNVLAVVEAGRVAWTPARLAGYGPLPGAAGPVVERGGDVAAGHGWRGRRQDATGFYNLGARHYDPTTGRFLSPDPLGHGASASLDDFANGDPVNGFDPDGRWGKDWNSPRITLDPRLLALGEVGFQGMIDGQARHDQMVRDLMRSYQERSSRPMTLDDFQSQLDVYGLLPGVGEPLDLLNGVISLGRGKYGEAALSLGAAVPFFGWGATGVKISQRADDAADAVAAVNRTPAALPSPPPLPAAAPGAVDELVTVRTYTNTAGREGISSSGHLRADTWVTLPSEIPSRAGHLQIERILEIQPGRGSHFLELQVPASNLRVPANGPRTSGGALQFQLNDPVPIDPSTFRRPPGRPGG